MNDASPRGDAEEPFGGGHAWMLPDGVAIGVGRIAPESTRKSVQLYARSKDGSYTVLAYFSGPHAQDKARTALALLDLLASAQIDPKFDAQAIADHPL